MSDDVWNPTGEQFTITRGSSRCTVTEVGATLRELVLDGVQVIETFPEDGAPRSTQGGMLVPWPNRVRDGRWTLGDSVQQLDVTEPKFHNASHGLLRSQAYRLGETDASRVVLTADIHPQRGYPFSLATAIAFELTDGGLEVTHTLANHGTEAAPVGVGTHGYYRIDDVDTDELTVTSSGSTIIEVDERMNPTGSAPVPEAKDLRRGRRVAELSLDDALTDMVFSESGRYEHRLAATDGRSVTVWGDEHFAWAQFYTSDRIREDGRRSLAIEPMTMPANAFNSGAGLTWLAPRSSWSVTWGVEYRATA